MEQTPLKSENKPLESSPSGKRQVVHYDIYGQVFAHAAYCNADFKATKPLKDVVRALHYYFNNHVHFETLNPDWKLSKGILLWGNVGVGKTTIMRLLKNNPRQTYDFINCRQLVFDFTTKGYDSIDKYFRPTTETWVNDDGTIGRSYVGVCFDDLGVEKDSIIYGDRTNVLEEILLNRYDNSVPFCQTHVITNLTTDELEQRYGTRVRSRMREMFNLIELHGTDMRK